MAIHPEVVDAIEGFEGFVPHPYPDPATGGKPWTQGFGSTRTPNGKAIKPSDPHIDRETARQWLIWDIERRFEPGVRKLIKPKLHSLSFGALVSFAYNVGVGNLSSSTLRRKVNRHDFEGASKEFKRWIFAAGRPMPGLVKRRAKEAEIFTRGVKFLKSGDDIGSNNTESAPSVPLPVPKPNEKSQKWINIWSDLMRLLLKIL